VRQKIYTRKIIRKPFIVRSSSMSVSSFLLVATLCCVCHGGFLSQKPEFSSALLRAEVKGVLSEVLGAGHGITQLRLARIRSTLEPMYRTLPQNNNGRLSKAVMRYAVRRYFSQEHGWIVKGFEPHADLVNTSDSTDILDGKASAYISSVLEEKFAHDGFALDDVVAMVAAVERLTFDEVVRTVETSFWLNDHSVIDELSHAQMMEVLSSYLIVTMSLWGDTQTKEAHLDKSDMMVRYPHWQETLLFLVDIAGSDDYERSPSSNPFVQEKTFSFTDLIRISERVSEEFGAWSNHECHEMKDILTERDQHGAGRVKLADFFRTLHDDAWQFTESPEYLRQLGAMDDTSPSAGPQVLIANYISGMSNCITANTYYNICCLNECDKIYQHLEAHLPASTTTPTELIKAVESMHLSVNITPQLRDRLDEVAQTNKGSVPLHGRLVAQWLHFAFPHECPYPHKKGTIEPKTNSKMRESGADDTVSKHEIDQIFEMDRGFGPVLANDHMRSWSAHESLLDASTPSDGNDSVWPNRLRITVQVCMLISCVAVVLRELSRAVRPAGKNKMVEYDV